MAWKVGLLTKIIRSYLFDCLSPSQAIPGLLTIICLATAVAKYNSLQWKRGLGCAVLYSVSYRALGVEINTDPCQTVPQIFQSKM